MSSACGENGAAGENGDEQQVLLMHPQASVVQGRRHFFPFGCTPPENLLGSIPKDARRADMLLLGCSDARHALFTLWMYGSEFNRQRDRWEKLDPEKKQQQQQDRWHPAEGLRTLRFTLNDREPACLARVLLLLQLFLDSRDELFYACSPSAAAHERDAYANRVALCFNAYYNIYLDNTTLDTVQTAANQLLRASSSLAAWSESPIGNITHIAGGDTLDRLRSMWYMYADPSIVKMKPKRSLDKERSAYHKLNVVPAKNLSKKLLTGEGPGVAAAKAMEWAGEMTGIHRQYQTWGYLDPFPVLRGGARSEQKFYSKTNPMMVATDHQELEFQLHHTCNPLSAFHQDNAWLNFHPRQGGNGEEEEEKEGGGGGGKKEEEWGVNEPLNLGPPRVSGIDVRVSKPRAKFARRPEAAQEYLLAKLLATSLEQMSRMCWAVNWASQEAGEKNKDNSNDDKNKNVADVRISFIAGDAVDTCDAISLLSAEGASAWGAARDSGEHPTGVCGFLPNMSLSPCRLRLLDIDGPARFDCIDTHDLSDSLGILNVVMAASPLLKPSPHSLLRTDLTRRGASVKRRSCYKELKHADMNLGDDNSRAYDVLRSDDWCATQVHECAMLLGVIPVTSIVPVVGHFHSMLEAARLAKTKKTNANAGDVGQRMRLAWKQACLIDQNAGIYVGSKDRVAMTLHPRLYMSPRNFADLILPFWMFMGRCLYFEEKDYARFGEGEEREPRVCPYTPASFARLLSHSLRFMKLERSHALEVIERLHKNCAPGVFGADVVAQLDVHLHLLALYKTEAMSAPDVVRWALDCPWWEKKPPSAGTLIVPAGSPGMCRVVLIASKEAVDIVRQLRDPALCVVLEHERQKKRILMSTLHCCFVRVHRGRGGSSFAFPQEDIEDVEGDPWYVVKERLIRVKECKPDDPEAELMVSFLLGSSTLVTAEVPGDIELELRLQDSSTRHVAAPANVARALEEAKGVIFRTNLSERGETAVIFPSSKAGATTLERFLPQSAKWEALLHDDKSFDPCLRQQRVGKRGRYIITPTRPELVRATEQSPLASRSAPLRKGLGRLLPCLRWTLQMSNPAARTLLSDKNTEVSVCTMPPCSVEIVLDAAEKDGGKGKKKGRFKAEDLSRGGIDGGLRYLLVLPFPIELARVAGREKDGLQLIMHLKQGYLFNPFIAVVQSIDGGGQQLCPPLLSNWSFPVRSTSDDRRLDLTEPLGEVLSGLKNWCDLEAALGGSALKALHLACCSLIKCAGSVNGKPKKPWHVLEVAGEQGMFLALYLQGVLVDESNECVLLDVCIGWLGPAQKDFRNYAAQSGGDRLKIREDTAELWQRLLPMAVERGRRTYAHRADCAYLLPPDGRAGPANVEKMPLCACGEGQDLPPGVKKALLTNGWSQVLTRLYRGVLPTMIPVEGERCGSPEPVPSCPAIAMSYSGPIRTPGSIRESVPAVAVRERGGGGPVRAEGRANGSGGGSEPVEEEIDADTAAILAKAGLKRMPQNTAAWARFERVQKGLPADPPCANCQEAEAKKRCTKCKNINYCSRDCQIKHWKVHKGECYSDA